MVTEDAYLDALTNRLAMTLYQHVTAIDNGQHFTLNAGGKVVYVRLTAGAKGMITLIEIFVLNRIKVRFPEWESVAALVMEECLNSDNDTELSEFGQTFWQNMLKDMEVAVDKNRWLLNPDIDLTRDVSQDTTICFGQGGVVV